MVIISFVALGVDAWWIYMLNTAPSKIASQSYNVGYQEIQKSDGTTEQKPLIELNLYDNVFEVVFNNVRDENQDGFYSKGVQYVASSGKGLNFDKSYSNYSNYDVYDKETGGIWPSRWEIYYCTAIAQKSTFKNLETYQYASADGFESVINNDMASPLDTDTLFRIQIGDGDNKKLYGMKLKGDKTYYKYTYGYDGSLKKSVKSNLNSDYKVEFHSESYTEKRGWKGYFEVGHVVDIYASLDLNLFSEILFNSIRGIEKGTSQDIIFNFGDYFDYYEYDGSTYSKVSLDGDAYNKVVKEVQSYYIIRVNVHDGDMTKSSESIMGMLSGSANVNTDAETGSYVYGKTEVKAEFNATARDFELVETSELGVYKFVLKQDFKNYYDDQKNNIVILVAIDQDYLTECGISFGGFESGTFGEFEVRGVENYA